MANFADILNKKADEIERPKPLPVGTYLAMVPGLPEMKEMGQNQTPCAEFTINFLQAQQDVDEEQLKAAGGLTTKEGKPKSLKLRQFLTEDSLYRMKEFAEHLGIEVEGKSIGEIIQETPGNQVYVTIKHRPSQDKQSIFAEIGGTAKV